VAVGSPPDCLASWRQFHGVHIDNSVLEDCEVEEKAEILREGELEVKRAAPGAHA
jgi:hypothetical protein